jgi:hypothetical protein
MKPRVRLYLFSVLLFLFCVTAAHPSSHRRIPMIFGERIFIEVRNIALVLNGLFFCFYIQPGTVFLRQFRKYFQPCPDFL